jgi:hypothetical protein
MNHSRLDKNDVNRKNIMKNASIEITAVKDNRSAKKLTEPGTLRLAKINNTNIKRSIKSNMNIESM